MVSFVLSSPSLNFEAVSLKKTWVWMYWKFPVERLGSASSFASITPSSSPYSSSSSYSLGWVVVALPNSGFEAGWLPPKRLELWLAAKILEVGLAADKLEVGWPNKQVVADGTENTFPDDGGPENNPAGSGLFWNRLVVVVTVWKRLVLTGCGSAEAFLLSSVLFSPKMFCFLLLSFG